MLLRRAVCYQKKYFKVVLSYTNQCVRPVLTLLQEPDQNCVAKVDVPKCVLQNSDINIVPHYVLTPQGRFLHAGEGLLI